MESIGQDHNAGHRSYVAELPPETVGWLYTKPFSDPPSYELARCLHGFAHIVESLSLTAGARVLDVGCGPGWMSEWLVRCGYRVTGVDISEDMIAIARERVRRVGAFENSGPDEISAEFHAMPVRDMDFEEEFDAAILYDAMHHFDDEAATLAVIHRALAPGGRIYIHEGIRPKPGSEGERELVAEMERYGTLEAPFDPEYLLQVVTDAGFTDVTRLVEVDRLLPADRERVGALRVRRQLAEPTTNTLIGSRSLPPGRQAGFGAELELIETRRNDDFLLVRIRAYNSGSQRWTAGASAPVLPPGGADEWSPARPSQIVKGAVTLGPVVVVDGSRVELQRGALPVSVESGESVEASVAVALPEIPVGAELLLDLVCEGVTWFEQTGSSPLRIPLD